MKEIISEVMLHMAVFMTFLMVFFFTFVVWIQQKAMIRDVSDMVHTLVGDTKINTAGAKFNAPQSMQDMIDKQNSKIVMIVSIVVPIAVIGLVVGAYFVAPHCFLHNSVNALSALPFIAIAEFTIVGAFMYNYVELDQQTVRQVASNFTGPWKNTNCSYVRTELSKLLPAWAMNIVFPPQPAGAAPSSPAVPSSPVIQ